MRNQKENKLHPSSPEFVDAFVHASTSCIECELCGRVHFAPNAGFDFEEGELEKLQEKALKAPDLYLEDSSDRGVCWGTIEGKHVVAGCPCNLSSSYEDFIWQHRFIIAEYLKLRINKELKEAQRQFDLLKKVPDLVSKLESNHL